MKRSLYVLFILLFLIVSCSKGSSNHTSRGVQELTLQKGVSGTISKVGDVNWYHYKASEAGNVLQVRCTSDTLRSDIQLLVIIYQLDSKGNKTILYGDHVPEKSIAPANLTLKTNIDQPKDIYIAVRDYKDDEASNKPYYLTIDYAGKAEGNDTIAQATPLTINASSCPTNTIGYVGDVDCFKFTSAGGIYDTAVNFSPLTGTPVQLNVGLYDSNAKMIESQTSPGAKNYHLIHYLSVGDYYVFVSDYGKDHFDNASTYQVCINSVNNTEAHGNDTIADATGVDLGQYSQDYTIHGSLDYSEDKDYYRIIKPATSSGFQVLHLSFVANTQTRYKISIVDANSSVIFSRTYLGGSSEFHTQLKLGNGSYYLMVQADDGQKITQSAPYTATVKMLDIVDDADMPPNDNNSIQNAIPLTPSPTVATSGKISYMGDVDWYNVTIPPHAQPQILEVYLNAPVSEVEYCLSIFGAQLIKTLSNPDAETIPTKLKTSFIIPASSSSGVYSFKVSDFRDDEGSDVTYTIRVDVKDIPTTLPAVADGAPPSGLPVQYYSELTETTASTVTLEMNSVNHKIFGVNTTLLDFSSATTQQNTPQSGLTTLTFPWIAGYVDYQGDQDWFLMNFQPLDTSTKWYYEIFVDFYAPATDVEYIWKFYPDRNKNSIVSDRTSDSDGFIASAGKTNNVPQILNIRTPSGSDGKFWVGDPWRGQTYFSISDFNYLFNPDSSRNLEPDDDWGGYNVAPYYFRVTLVYHPGVSYPQP
ncbi:MAG: hypothetical protein ABSC14_05185 [Desulfomonilia bacterium]|jgi:hypothetical protein